MSLWTCNHQFGFKLSAGKNFIQEYEQVLKESKLQRQWLELTEPFFLSPEPGSWGKERDKFTSVMPSSFLTQKIRYFFSTYRLARIIDEEKAPPDIIVI